jgi:hypothetical protein
MALGALGALSIGGSVLGTGASIFGKVKEAKARSRFDNWVKGQSNKLEAWYAKERNTDYLDTAEGKSISSGLKKTLKDQINREKEGAIKTGGSHEAEVATKEQAFESLGDSYRKLAGLGTQRNENLRRSYLQQKSNLDSMKAGNMQNTANAWSTFANNAGSVAGNWIGVGAENGVFDFLKSKKKQGLQQSS